MVFDAMSKDIYGYPCEPKALDEMTWFYEEREGLQLVIELFEGAKTARAVIPWPMLCRAVDRHRKIAANKPRKQRLTRG